VIFKEISTLTVWDIVSQVSSEERKERQQATAEAAAEAAAAAASHPEGSTHGEAGQVDAGAGGEGGGVSAWLAGVREERGLGTKPTATEEQATMPPAKGIVSIAEQYGGKVAKATQLKKEKAPKKRKLANDVAKGEQAPGGKPKRAKAGDAMASKDTRTAEEKKGGRGKWH